MDNEVKYVGHGAAGGNWGVMVVSDVAGSPAVTALPHRLDLRNHSPDGFAWGYGGSGPAQLALAILAHTYDDDFAQEWYQRFKEQVIAPLNMDEDFTLSQEDVRTHMAEIMLAHAAQQEKH